MNPENGVFESRLIDPDEVDWARVMVIYKLLTMSHSTGERKMGVGTRLKFDLWLRSKIESGTVEFELAMRIMFDVLTDARFDDLDRILSGIDKLTAHDPA